MEKAPVTFSFTKKGEIIMKVSKLKIVAKYFTGGIAGVVE